ncbi:MAG: hypothetical protein DHS20C14_20600 [Phycisphaeraceae bacterium]|nr:MAG: hypothetical protein DHS20C14_20600 [Phycisphaeraceae bacterium]
MYNGSAKDIGIPLPGEWSVFERWIEPGVGGGPPHFVGPAATAVWGKPIELAIGDTCHLGNHDPAATTLDPFDCQLMSAGGFDWGRRYDISKLDRAILRDCGIPTVPSTP